ncbi:uncharacterized protein LOC100381834 [Zea mays]|jgi:F-box interacting protein|uniref:F-box domain containing protein expressed n=1 Tax=Zea mays TaxID=4577 RepID=C0HJ71_MAIZE|nr:uncharacterized protein LOC100381834 [Zea mays]ACN27074.1 unknown [Zea mays]ONM02053.1 F-box domain containing protein expressed [Zea mays]|eukprot:NP_001168097.1 uncharacterized protein LOC100381834 [Zea mays]
MEALKPERVVDDAAADFICDAPSNALDEILVRLSPKWTLRMRSVCRAWRDKLDHWATRSRRKNPPQPLLCFDRVACPDRYVRLTDYCVESLDLRSGRPHHVLRFTASDYYEAAGARDDDDDDPPGDTEPEVSRVVDYAKMERENYADGFKQMVLLHASVDGYLLVSFSFDWYVINPATRHWASIPDLTLWNVIGFYEHFSSGEYRVLCSGGRTRTSSTVDEGPERWYHIVTVTRPVQWRSIGRPIARHVPRDHGLAAGVRMAGVSPPVQLRHRHLHWPPQKSQGYRILVFDIWVDAFSWKEPAPVTDMDQKDMALLEFPNGRLGMSVSGKNLATVELWRLEDYHNELWVLAYRIQLPLPWMRLMQDDDCWIPPSVVSADGDVLILSGRWLLHCDRNGNLLREFGLPHVRRMLPIRHVLRESLVQHRTFLNPKPAREPPFFRWLCGDPSW